MRLCAYLTTLGTLRPSHTPRTTLASLFFRLRFDRCHFEELSKPPENFAYNPESVGVKISTIEDQTVPSLMVSSLGTVVRCNEVSSKYPMLSRRAQFVLQDGFVGLNDAKPMAPNSKAELVVDVVHEEGFIEVSALCKNARLHESAGGHQCLYLSEYRRVVTGARHLQGSKR